MPVSDSPAVKEVVAVFQLAGQKGMSCAPVPRSRALFSLRSHTSVSHPSVQSIQGAGEQPAQHVAGAVSRNPVAASTRPPP
mmetsp:Transcript_3706/g.9259  ORF Transcript_3706/g.9259 Transcript_3706/m.9259 type:complete len:81 (-) Transcript_3706:196-438(-)